MLGNENGLVFAIYVSDKKFKDSMDLLHYVHIKDFNRFMFQKKEKKNVSVKVVYNILVVKMY